MPRIFRATPRRDVTTHGKALKALAADGYTLVFGTLSSRSERFAYRCPAQHEHTMSVDNFLQGRRCPDCARVLRGKARRLGLEEVRKAFAHEGYTLTATEYRDSRAPLACICPNGHPWQVSWQGFHTKGTRCRLCHWQAKTLSWEEAIAPILAAGYEVLGGRDLYQNLHSTIRVRCPEGHQPYLVKVYNFRNGRRCPGCGSRTSAGERELFAYISLLMPDAISGTRSVLEGQQEIDVYCASVGVGIEFHGLYFHSDRFGKSPRYHVDKLVAAAQRGIRLLQFFEDEWGRQQEIVKALIARALGRVQVMQEGEVRPLGDEERRLFLERNDLEGDCPASAWGMFVEGELVQVLAAQLRADGDVELVRMTVRCGMHVRWEDGRLLEAVRRWAASRGAIHLIVRINRRFDTPEDYFRTGFVFFEATPPREWATDYLVRFRPGDGNGRKDQARLFDCGDLVLRRPAGEPIQVLQEVKWQSAIQMLPPDVPWVRVGTPTRRAVNLKKRSEVVAFIESEGYRIMGGMEQYRNTASRLLVQCPAGHPAYSVKVGNFHAGKRCRECGIIRRATKKRTSLEDIRAALEAEGYRLISTHYLNGKTPLEAICPRGHTWNFRWGNFKTGYRCFDCVDRKFLTRDRDEMVRPILEAGYRIVAGLEAYENSRSRLTIQCPNGHPPYPVQVIKFRIGRRCPKCARLRVA